MNSAAPNLIQDVGAGSPNRLLFSEARHAFLGQNILPFISEGTFGVDSGIDIGPGQWLTMSGGGQIWSGVPLSLPNGRQGWNFDAGAVQWFGNPTTNVSIAVKMPCTTC